MATTVIVTTLSTICSLLLEGKHKIVPIPPNEFSLQLVNASSIGVNGTVIAEYAFTHYGGGIEVFCLEEHCIFGWMSKEWVYKILVFGLWVGVFCIAGFNYAVSECFGVGYLRTDIHDFCLICIPRCNIYHR